VAQGTVDRREIENDGPSPATMFYCGIA
jgi:hypothetical protein